MFYIEVALAIVGQAFVFQFCPIENRKNSLMMFLFSVLAPFFVVRNAVEVFIGIFFGTFSLLRYFSSRIENRKMQIADQQILEALYFDLLAGVSIRSSLKKWIGTSTSNAVRARFLLDSLEMKNGKNISAKDVCDEELKKALIDIETNQLRPISVISLLRNQKKMKEDFRRRSRAMSLNPRLQFALMFCFFLIVALNFWTQNNTDAPRIVLYWAVTWFILGGIVFFRMARSFKWRI